MHLWLFSRIPRSLYRTSFPAFYSYHTKPYSVLSEQWHPSFFVAKDWNYSSRWTSQSYIHCLTPLCILICVSWITPFSARQTANLLGLPRRPCRYEYTEKEKKECESESGWLLNSQKKFCPLNLVKPILTLLLRSRALFAVCFWLVGFLGCSWLGSTLTWLKHDPTYDWVLLRSVAKKRPRHLCNWWLLASTAGDGGPTYQQRAAQQRAVIWSAVRRWPSLFFDSATRINTTQEFGSSLICKRESISHRRSTLRLITAETCALSCPATDL